MAGCNRCIAVRCDDDPNISFFHPALLMPRTRALVNLTQVRAGEARRDPFAGTCGILIEACLVGLRSLGIEVQPRLGKEHYATFRTWIAACC